MEAWTVGTLEGFPRMGWVDGGSPVTSCPELARRLGAPAPRADAAAASGSRRSRSSKRCSNRLLRAAGWRPVYPSYREGYGALLAGGA